MGSLLLASVTRLCDDLLMKTILVPLDLSDVYPKVVIAAAELAKELSARICLLQVIEPVTSYVPVGAAMDVIAVPSPLSIPQDLEDRKKSLDAIAAPLREQGLTVETNAVLGLPVDEILEAAKSRGASYILIGSHGHGALYHLFSGSVVTGVIKSSTIPVIVIPVKKAA